MPVTRAVAAAGLGLLVLWGFAIVALGASALLAWDEWEVEGWWWYGPVLVVTTALGLWGVARAVRPLWRTVRYAEARVHALARFSAAWIAVLPWSFALYYVAYLHLALTVTAVPVVALLLLAERHMDRARAGATDQSSS